MKEEIADKPKILIVDDDPNIVMSLEYLLSKNKYIVYIARNGNEALEAVQNHCPDIVLLDIMLPDVNGFEICAYIKDNPQYQHAKVIFLSAISKASDVKKGFDAGASKYIVKPFSTRKLMEDIKELSNKVF